MNLEQTIEMRVTWEQPTAATPEWIAALFAGMRRLFGGEVSWTGGHAFGRRRRAALEVAEELARKNVLDEL